MKMETLTLSMTRLLAMIARSRMATETVSMISPLAYGTMGSSMISAGSSGGDAALTA